MGQVRDRIDSELGGAERELDEAAGSSARSSVAEDRNLSDADAMMRRAEERIASARREMEARSAALLAARDDASGAVPRAVPENGTSKTAPSLVKAAEVSAMADPNFHDYRVLGVPPGSDLSVIQAEYEKLSRRCDPRRFPEGSSEQKQAAQILARVNTSYEALHHRLDPTENRFGKLELE